MRVGGNVLAIFLVQQLQRPDVGEGEIQEGLKFQW